MKGLSGLLWRGLKPKLPEKLLLQPKYPAVVYLFWNVPGSCCSDLTHLKLSLISHVNRSNNKNRQVIFMFTNRTEPFS